MINRVFLLVLIALLLTFAIAFALSASNNRQVISSGGGFTQSGKFSVHATIGQSVVGVTGITNNEIQAGFWNGSIPKYEIFLPKIIN